MATDRHGEFINEERVAGMERFHCNDIPNMRDRLKREWSEITQFSLDGRSTVVKTLSEEDRRAYENILPSQVSEYVALSVGDVITFAMQSALGHGHGAVLKDFRCTHQEIAIEQNNIVFRRFTIYCFEPLEGAMPSHEI